jgi:5-methylcytosine-specific restriction endonuclease McrA
MPQHPLEHRFKRLATGANRKAQRLGRPGRISFVDLYELYIESEGVCTYCGIGVAPESCSFDHVVPFDRDGDNIKANIVVCCLTCQRAKFTKMPAEFEAWKQLEVTCPVDGKVFRPRWADYIRGYGKYCSRRCSGAVGGQSR